VQKISKILARSADVISLGSIIHPRPPRADILGPPQAGGMSIPSGADVKPSFVGTDFFKPELRISWAVAEAATEAAAGPADPARC